MSHRLPTGEPVLSNSSELSGRDRSLMHFSHVSAVRMSFVAHKIDRPNMIIEKRDLFVRSRRAARGRLQSRLQVVVVAMLSCATITVVAPDSARADGGFESEGDQSQYDQFYTPPDPLPPGEPGDLIRTEPSRLVLEPSGQLGAIMATGTRIMYRSTDTRGNPIAVTGTYFEPDNPCREAGRGRCSATRQPPSGRGISARCRGSSTKASTGRRGWT